jgi:HAD superfamily hydrolase (TIGR01490 family)
MKNRDNPTFAYFDLDDTISAGDSILYWNLFLFQNRPLKRRLRWIPYLGLIFYALRIISVHTLKRYLLAPTSFLHPEERQELAKEFVQTQMLKFFYPEMVQRMHLHKNQGHKVVLVSASADFYLEFLTMWLPADIIVGTPMSFPTRGFFRLPKYERGNFKGENKVTYLKESEDFPDSGAGAYGYSDHHSDSPLLNYVEHSFVVHPNPRLLEEAVKKEWSRLYPFRRRFGKKRKWEKLRLLICAKGKPENRLNPNVGNRAQGVKEWALLFQNWFTNGEISKEVQRKALRLKGLPQALQLASMRMFKHHEERFVGVSSSYKGAGYAKGLPDQGRIALNGCYSYWYCMPYAENIWTRELMNGAKPTHNLDHQFLQYRYKSHPQLRALLEILEECSSRELYDRRYRVYFDEIRGLIEETSLNLGRMLPSTKSDKGFQVEQEPHQNLSLFHIKLWKKWNIEIPLTKLLLQAFVECLERDLFLNINWGQWLGWSHRGLELLDVVALKKTPKGIGKEISNPSGKLSIFESYLGSINKDLLIFKVDSSEALILKVLSPLFSGDFDYWCILDDEFSNWKFLGQCSPFLQEIIFNLYQIHSLCEEK